MSITPIVDVSPISKPPRPDQAQHEFRLRLYTSVLNRPPAPRQGTRPWPLGAAFGPAERSTTQYSAGRVRYSTVKTSPFGTRTPCRVHRTYPSQQCDCPDGRRTPHHPPKAPVAASTVHDRPVAGSVAVTTSASMSFWFHTSAVIQFPLTATAHLAVVADVTCAPVDRAGDAAGFEQPPVMLQAAEEDDRSGRRGF